MKLAIPAPRAPILGISTEFEAKFSVAAIQEPKANNWVFRSMEMPKAVTWVVPTSTIPPARTLNVLAAGQ